MWDVPSTSLNNLNNSRSIRAVAFFYFQETPHEERVPNLQSAS
jgi:hypothetical protein